MAVTRPAQAYASVSDVQHCCMWSHSSAGNRVAPRRRRVKRCAHCTWFGRVYGQQGQHAKQNRNLGGPRAALVAAAAGKAGGQRAPPRRLPRQPCSNTRQLLYSNEVEDDATGQPHGQTDTRCPEQRDQEMVHTAVAALNPCMSALAGIGHTSGVGVGAAGLARGRSCRRRVLIRVRRRALHCAGRHAAAAVQQCASLPCFSSSRWTWCYTGDMDINGTPATACDRCIPTRATGIHPISGCERVWAV
jgi:hypothetical protein